MQRLLRTAEMRAMQATCEDERLDEEDMAVFKDELKDFIIESAEGVAKKIEDDLDVREMVRLKVEAFSSDKLEDLLSSLMKKEFRKKMNFYRELRVSTGFGPQKQRASVHDERPG